MSHLVNICIVVTALLCGLPWMFIAFLGMLSLLSFYYDVKLHD